MLALMDPKISISQDNMRKSDKNVFANQISIHNFDQYDFWINEMSIDKLISDSTKMHVSCSLPPAFWKFKIGIGTPFQSIYAIQLGLRSGWKNKIKKELDTHINF